MKKWFQTEYLVANYTALTLPHIGYFEQKSQKAPKRGVLALNPPRDTNQSFSRVSKNTFMSITIVSTFWQNFIMKNKRRGGILVKSGAF